MTPTPDPMFDVYKQAVEVFQSSVKTFAKLAEESATLFLMGVGTAIIVFTLFWDSWIADTSGVSRLPQAESIAAISAATVMLLVGGLGRLYTARAQRKQIEIAMNAAAIESKRASETLAKAIDEMVPKGKDIVHP